MGFIISKELDQFIEDNTTPQDEVLQALDRATHLHFMMPQMISGTVQGKFLEMLSCMAKPERILEIGTFTGYIVLKLKIEGVACGLSICVLSGENGQKKQPFNEQDVLNLPPHNVKIHNSNRMNGF